MQGDLPCWYHLDQTGLSNHSPATSKRTGRNTRVGREAIVDPRLVNKVVIITAADVNRTRNAERSTGLPWRWIHLPDAWSRSSNRTAGHERSGKRREPSACPTCHRNQSPFYFTLKDPRLTFLRQGKSSIRSFLSPKSSVSTKPNSLLRSSVYSKHNARSRQTRLRTVSTPSAKPHKT